MDEPRHRCFTDLFFRPSGGARVAVQDRFAGAVALLSAEEARRLASCRRFATLAAHAARLAATSGQPIGELRRELETRAAEGLLISEADLRAEVTRVSEITDGGATIRYLGIPTRARPAALARLLRSLGDLEGGRHLLVSHCGDVDLPSGVIGIGPEQRRDYAARLAERVGEPELLTWALAPSTSGFAAGGSRNALLLAAVDEPLLMLDDDTLAELRTTGSERPLTITSASDPTELWFGEPPAQESPSSALVAWHERLLGRSVAGLIDEATDLTALDGRFARRLAGGARVITTQLGVAGDSGTDSLGHLLLLRGASRQRLLVDEATYEAVWTTRRMIRGVTAPTVNDGSGLMSYCLGIDTRELLPPVPPVARNGDGVFGLALRACRADYAGGWLPVTIRHEPVERRESSFAATLSGLTTLGPNDYLGRVIAALGAPKTADPAAAMRQLGATLQAMAESAGFAQDLHEIVVAGRSADRRRLEEVLAEHDHEPSHWAQDVRRAIMEVDASLSGGPPALPEVAEHVARYGRLLRLWPDVVAAARELRARGEGLGAASTGS